MEIGQSTWSHQTVVLSERDGSEEEIILPSLHNQTHNTAMRHGRVGQPGPRKAFIDTSIKYTTVIMDKDKPIAYMRHSRTRKP